MKATAKVNLPAWEWEDDETSAQNVWFEIKVKYGRLPDISRLVTRSSAVGSEINGRAAIEVMSVQPDEVWMSLCSPSTLANILKECEPTKENIRIYSLLWLIEDRNGREHIKEGSIAFGKDAVKIKQILSSVKNSNSPFS